MAEIDHWHPVLTREELGQAPVGVRVAGRDIVVFRTAAGDLGALDDRCPHRGMRLSTGRVEGTRLVCPYHGWQWAPDGQGVSPGNPHARPCAEHYDVVERHGAIWVTRGRATTRTAGDVPALPPAFPAFDVSGYFEVGRSRRRLRVPLELALDNFIEVEHTPTTHALLGYPRDRMHEVECVTTVSDTSVRVFNAGPQRRLPSLLYRLYGVPRDVWFVDDWTTYFSPVYTVYDQYWIDATTREQIREALRIAVFFNPVGPEATELFVFTYTQAPPWGRYGANALLAPLTRAFVELEIRNDARMLERLADKSTSLHGRALGRFDKALVAARRRVDRIYRGTPVSGASPS